MDKITRKTSFGQWFSPININLFDEQVKTLKLDYYTKKLTTEYCGKNEPAVRSFEPPFAENRAT
ncbi:hypothetical protein GCM10011351_20610 [Paraliobacillus quinghaiensis]|uniref:DUF4372 domain-containing protein n=1 Tax=Paraliobacillus quinghaiensis TaxID=470815 RepID=A0A917TTH9_9BACI|nr:hypothetical protein GCM10011351_20610 [Paraliobacillus quinghaiensis]